MADDIFDVEFEEVSEGNEEVKKENKKEEVKAEEPEKEVKVEKETTVVEKKSTEITEDGLDITFEGLDNVPGVQVADTGTKVSKYPIEKMRYTEAKKEMISVLTKQVIIVKRHYDEDTGSFFCFDGKCCEYLGLPDVRYIYPVVVYDTNKKGQPVSKDIEIKALILPKDAYDDLSSKDEFNEGGITSVDLVASCTDETYQRVTYSVAGAARWKKSGEIKKYVADFWKKNAKYLTLAAGRTLKEGEFLNLKGAGGNAQIEDDVDFDDVF